MPLIQIKYATPTAAAGLDAALAARASQLAQQRLGKDPALTAVLVERADPAHWFCAGRSLAEAGLSGFWLDIRVTEGTNTKDEKAAFIAETFAAFSDMLGPSRGKLCACGGSARRRLWLCRPHSGAALHRRPAVRTKTEHLSGEPVLAGMALRPHVPLTRPTDR